MGEKVILLDADNINRMLTRISYQILENHKYIDKLALIGIQTRGVFLARRIQFKILEIAQLEPRVGNLDINLYRDDWTRISHQPVVKPSDIKFSVDGLNVILIDDVLFTGRTIRAAMEALLDFGRPDLIELAVLADRGHRELPIQATYVGTVVETRHSETVNVLLNEYDDIDQVVIE